MKFLEKSIHRKKKYVCEWEREEWVRKKMKKRNEQHIFSRIHRYIKFTLNTLHVYIKLDVEERFATYAWLYMIYIFCSRLAPSPLLIQKIYYKYR